MYILFLYIYIYISVAILAQVSLSSYTHAKEVWQRSPIMALWWIVPLLPLNNSPAAPGAHSTAAHGATYTITELAAPGAKHGQQIGLATPQRAIPTILTSSCNTKGLLHTQDRWPPKIVHRSSQRDPPRNQRLNQRDNPQSNKRITSRAPIPHNTLGVTKCIQKQSNIKRTIQLRSQNRQTPKLRQPRLPLLEATTKVRMGRHRGWHPPLASPPMR